MNEDFTVKGSELDYLRIARYGMMPDKVVFLTFDGQQFILPDDPEKNTVYAEAHNPAEATAMFEYIRRGIPGIVEPIRVEELNPYHLSIYQTEVSDACKRFEQKIRSRWARVPINKVLDYIDKIGDYADWYNGVVEMGYDDKPMICANWNPPKMKRLGDWIEKFYQDNIEVDWSDEWMACSDCGKAVRSSPNSYGWETSWVWASDCEIVCRECVENSKDDVIEFYQNCLEGTATRALPSWMQPMVEDAGFKCLESEDAYCTRFESGFHPGQNDTPEGCLKLAKEILPHKFDYVFVITGVGQFDIHWAMFVRKVEDEDD